MSENSNKINNFFKNFLNNDNEDPNKVKKAQQTKIIISACAIGALFTFGIMLTDEEPPKKVSTKIDQSSVLNVQDRDNIARNKWLNIANEQLENNAERLQKLEKENEKQKRVIDKLLETMSSNNSQNNSQLLKMLRAEIAAAKKDTSSDLPRSPLLQTDLDASHSPNTAKSVELMRKEFAEFREKLLQEHEQKAQKIEQISDEEAPVQQQQQVAPALENVQPAYPPVPAYPPMPQRPHQPAFEEIIEDETIEDTLSFQQFSQATETAAEPEPVKKKDILQIPATSILRGTLLSGADAPTMAKGKSDPLPILIQLTDFSIGANHRRQDLRDCFVIAEAVGDLASERAYIRTNTLHCVNSTNDSIIADLKGYVSGEDGKNGLRGRIVTKAGALIGRTILASTVQGIGAAFGNLGKTTIVGGAGITDIGNASVNNENRTLPSARDVRAALGEGIAQASSKLADFYLKMADEVSPVIEISAGRKVEIIVTETTEVDFDNTKNYHTTIERDEEDDE